MLHAYIQLIVNIKTDDVYEDIANDVEKIFDMLNCVAERPLPIGKIKKMIGLMKNELGGRIMTEFVRLGSKTYSDLIDDGIGDEKLREQKLCNKRRT